MLNPETGSSSFENKGSYNDSMKEWEAKASREVGAVPNIAIPPPPKPLPKSKPAIKKPTPQQKIEKKYTENPPQPSPSKQAIEPLTQTNGGFVA